MARALGLEPHPEGGWYRRSYTSPVSVPHPVSGGPRPTATLIYYLLCPGEESRWHRVASDEVWLWRHGGPLTVTTTPPGRRPGVEQTVVLGADTGSGQQLQALVPAGHWQRAEAGDAETLVTCMVTPGFDFADFHLLPEAETP
ncbi:cupin domain-containing protein [Streptacidiphilus sp. PB12-B1b]|nr:cupin domain-containing protein [Streptacidiphilus sp. PB12-B1b]